MEKLYRYDVSIIIVNYNTVSFLEKCLISLEKLRHEVSFEVIVADNNSSDGSREMISTKFSYLKFLPFPENLGFGKANNEAMKISEGEYLFFLNPDTVVKLGCLKAALKYMKEHQDVGLAGTKILNPDETAQSSFEVKYPKEKYVFSLTELPGRIAWVLGASMIVSKKTMESISGFDERYFLYGEDLDLCLRIRKLGLQIGFIPDAEIIHWEGQSEKSSLPSNVFEKKLEAELIFYDAHYSIEEIRSIKRAHILEAWFHIISLTISFPFYFFYKKSLWYCKFERYKAIINIVGKSVATSS